jgi:hypothetical protein
MSNLNQSWTDRVADVQRDLTDIRDETAAIDRQREQLRIERNTFATNSKAEKMRCQEDMRALEAGASVTAGQLQSAAERRAEAERIAAQAQHDYQDLLHLMNEIKSVESSLAAREIPAEALERESGLWCTEEEALRDRMRAVERDIVEQRRAGAEAVRSAEEEARHAEGELHAARMARNADEGTGPFVFSDAVARQHADLIELDCAVAMTGVDGRVRKGRSASGRNVNVNSRKGSLAGNNSTNVPPQPLQQRRVNIVDEDAS